jgi:hypothetical protein
LPIANLRTFRVLHREFQRRASLGFRIMVILYGSGISKFENSNSFLIYWYRALGHRAKSKKIRALCSEPYAFYMDCSDENPPAVYFFTIHVTV